jgi:histone H3/H4
MAASFPKSSLRRLVIDAGFARATAESIERCGNLLTAYVVNALGKAAACSRCARRQSITRAAVHFALVASGLPPPLDLTALTDEQLRGVQRCISRTPSAVRCSSPLSVAIAEATFARVVRKHLLEQGFRRLSGSARRYLQVAAEAHAVAVLGGLHSARPPADPREELLGAPAAERLQWLCSIVSSLASEAKTTTVSLRIVETARMCLPASNAPRPSLVSRNSVARIVRGLLSDKRVRKAALAALIAEVVEIP